MAIPVDLETIEDDFLAELLAVDYDVEDPEIKAVMAELMDATYVRIPPSVYDASINDTPRPFNELLVASPVSYQPFIAQRPYSLHDFEWADDGAATSAGVWLKRYTAATHLTYERATKTETTLTSYSSGQFYTKLKGDVNMACAGRDAKRGAAHPDVVSTVVANVVSYLTSMLEGCDQLNTATLKTIPMLFNRVKRLTKTTERAWRLIMHGIATCPMQTAVLEKARCMLGYGMCRYYSVTKRPAMTTTDVTAAHLLVQNRDYAALLAFPLSVEEWWTLGSLDMLPVELALWDTVRSRGDKDAHATFVVAYHLSRVDLAVDGEISDRLGDLVNVYNTMLLTRELKTTSQVASVMNGSKVTSAVL